MTALNQVAPVLGVSSLGLVEFHNVLARNWRSTDAVDSQYDQAWVESEQDRIMRAIISRRIVIVATPSKFEEKALVLVKMATRDHGMALGAWDAVHLVTAVAWSFDLQNPIDLWTTDAHYDRFLGLYTHFSRYVSVVNLDP